MLSVIFPAHNEADNLRRFPGEVLTELDALGRPYEVLVVDDGSTDDTAAVAAGLGPKVRVVRHPQNLGLGAALRTGFENARGDLVVTLDADLTFAASLVGTLLARFEQGNVDAVSGSPALAGFGTDIPPHRVLVSKASTFVYSALLGQPVTAVSPILRLYRRADLQKLELRADGFEINAEILFELLRRNLRVSEVPALLTQRTHGTTKLKYRVEMRRHLRLLGRLVAWRARRTRS
jgi:glycosyltransferase involved in cell wall biosynthesis